MRNADVLGALAFGLLWLVWLFLPRDPPDPPAPTTPLLVGDGYV